MSITLILCLFCVAHGAYQIEVVQTAKDTQDRLTQKSSIYFSTKNVPNKFVVSIDPQEQYQKIFGFGGAFTEAAAYVYSKMNKENQQKILQAYFYHGEDEPGLRYSVGRVHMNSCDFCLASYSFDDTEGDYSLSHFNISHDTLWLIPFIQDAMKYSKQDIRLFLTPWSPPAWMKGNNQMDGSSIPGLKADPMIYKSWALYYSKFITAHAKYGINFWYFHGMFVWVDPHQQELDFLVGYLGPRMKQDHPNVKIMIYDHNKDHVDIWAKAILSNATAYNYVDGVAFHWYTGTNNFANGCDNYLKDHSLKTYKQFTINFQFLLPSEACNCPPSLDNWDYAENYGYDIIGDLNVWAVGWTDWNMVLDMQGGPNHLEGYCNAPILCDAENQTCYIQPTYYYFGQIAKFVVPDSVRVNTTLSMENQDISTVAFLTPDKVVVVIVMNTGNTTLPITLATGENNEYSANYNLPPHAITTFMYDAW